MMKSVIAKLHTMRKSQDFVVLAMSDGRYMIQSDKSIGVFDPNTGKGRLCVKGQAMHHLAMHGFAFEFPADFIKECADVIADNGEFSSLGGGVVITNNVVKVIG
jgi:hypothetical protein